MSAQMKKKFQKRWKRGKGILFCLFLLVTGGKAVAEEQPVTVRMAIWTPYCSREEFDRIEKALNVRMEEALGIRLAVDFIPSGQKALFDYLFQTPGADLIYVQEIGSQVNHDLLLPLDDLLETEGEHIRQVIPQSYLEYGKIDGKIYGIPRNIEMGYRTGICMRKDLVEKYGIEVSGIEDWDDVTKILKTVTEEENIYGLMADVSYACNRMSDFYGALVLEGQEPEIVDYFETEEFRQWLYQVRSWAESGYLYTQDDYRYSIGLTRSLLYELVNEGKLFAYVASYKPGLDVQESRACGCEMISIPIEENVSFGDGLANRWGIYVGSEHPEEAMKVLDFLYYDSETANLFCWGIEGEDYQIHADGTIGYPEGKEKDSVGYFFNRNWLLPNQYAARSWEGDSPQMGEEIRKLNQEIESMAGFGFLFDSTSVYLECRQIDQVLKEYLPGFMCGLYEVDQILPMMINELKTAGMDQVVEEKQRQFDLWMTENEK